MKNQIISESPTFLAQEKGDFESSIYLLNLYLSSFEMKQKPYKIDYHTLLLSYKLWGGTDLDEFCHKQTISHFLFNPVEDSGAAREAFFIEIREFLFSK